MFPLSLKLDLYMYVIHKTIRMIYLYSTDMKMFLIVEMWNF